MAGNLLGNLQIHEYQQTGIIRITPFRQDRLKWAWYAIHPYHIWNDLQIKNSEEDIELIPLTSKGYVVEPGDHVVVEAEEVIVLPDGIVGQFIPASHSIEKGGVLTVGKLDPGYDMRIVFGFMNAKRHPIELYPDSPLVYIQFYDIRETSCSSITAKSEYEKQIQKIRNIKGAADLLEQMAHLVRNRTHGEE